MKDVHEIFTATANKTNCQMLFWNFEGKKAKQKNITFCTVWSHGRNKCPPIVNCWFEQVSRQLHLLSNLLREHVPNYWNTWILFVCQNNNIFNHCFQVYLLRSALDLSIKLFFSLFFLCVCFNNSTSKFPFSALNSCGPALLSPNM